MAALLTTSMVPMAAFAVEDGTPSQASEDFASSTDGGDSAGSTDGSADAQNLSSASDVEDEGLTAEEEYVKGSESPSAVQSIVRYVYIESPEIAQGSIENLVIGFQDEASAPSSATLFLRSIESGDELEVDMDSSIDGAVLFGIDTSNISSGSYELVRFDYVSDGKTVSLDFSLEEEEYSFTVTEKEIAEDSDGATSYENSGIDNSMSSADGVDTSVVTTDEQGDAVEVDSIEEAIDEAGQDSAIAPYSLEVPSAGRSLKASSPLVVVLDPGHGGYDPGASGNGVTESAVNLKIAQYCYNELSQYKNVKVLMTRESDTYVSLQDRVDFAVDNDADLVVSIHNNSSTAYSANGAEVIVPRAGEYHEIGQELGNLILDQIEALGLDRRAVYSKDCTSGDHYEDGSLMDYYTMISGPREHGITGIIVEHAFVSNGSDASFLKSESNLKKLGVADATAIANYYGLSKYSALYGFSDVYEYTDHVEDIGWLASTGISEGFPDGTFRPMASVARQDMAAFLYRLAGSPDYEPTAADLRRFPDVNTETSHYKEILWLASEGITEGFPDGTFRPGASIARQDMAAFLRRTYDYMTDGGSKNWKPTSADKKSFSDVSSSTDHAQDIWWLASTGVSQGFPDGTFRGFSSVVRQDMAAFLHRLGTLPNAVLQTSSKTSVSGSVATAGYHPVGSQVVNVGLSESEAKTRSMAYTDFSDVSELTDHYSEILWLASTGISEGFPDGTFRPMASVARQDMAAFLYRLAGSPDYEPTAADLRRFPDVNTETSHYKEILWLASEGITEGFPDGTFRPGASIARQDMAAFLRRTYDYMTDGGSAGWTVTSYWKSFFDDVSEETDHSEDIWWLAAMGVSQGFSDGTFRGVSSVVRQDMAAFLYRLNECGGSGVSSGVPIMGVSDVAVDDLVLYFDSTGHSYPSGVYSAKGAATIEDFARIVIEEAEMEGVRADVVFCQAMKETGWLQFGGSVKADQCNFAGLGATSGTEGGASFPDVRTGVRAQVQHLKAYASKDPLVNECVDPRFDLVSRGCAPTLTDLNGRWAVPGTTYGQDIAAMIDAMHAKVGVLC